MRTARALALAFLAGSAEAKPRERPSWVLGDPVFAAAEAELLRSLSRLSVEGTRPYDLSYRIVDQRRVQAAASFGALKSSSEERRRLASADLRVGSPAFDNTHFLGSDGGGHSPFTISAPYEDGVNGLRHALWWLTDAAFKGSLQRYSQKDAFRRTKSVRADLPDRTPAPVTVLDASSRPPPLERGRAEETARRASRAFTGTPGLHGSRVTVSYTESSERFLDAEGRRVRKDGDDYDVLLTAWTQAPDGMSLSEQRRLIAGRPEGLPTDEAVEAEARALAAELGALRAAGRLEETYIGPVLFEGQAAGEFFNQLLARGLAAPRELWLEDEGLREDHAAGPLTGRLGLRVMNPILGAYDDPTQAAFASRPLAGHYMVDDEGVPARRVDLVERGILKDLLMGRAPAHERSASNGHARAALEQLPSARIGCLFVDASSGVPRARLRAELLRLAAEQGLPFAVVVRRLGVEEEQRPGELLAAPVYAFKLYPDGREQVFRGGLFDAVTLRALRDVSVASSERRVYDFYQGAPYGNGDDDVPASIVHPDVVVAEMELVPEEREPDRLPYLASPLAAKR